jgi:hypothetical protein
LPLSSAGARCGVARSPSNPTRNEDVVVPAHDHQRSIVDLAIHRAYAGLAPQTAAELTRLLACARSRAPRLLEPLPRERRRVPAVEALVNLGRHRHAWIRPLDAWAGSEAWGPGAVGSLAQHVTARYPVPGFLASAWHAEAPYTRAACRWYLGHASGRPFRAQPLPIAMSRTMEDAFLRSPAHYEVVYAMRRAELVGLCARPALIDAVMRTPLASDLSHGDFWRSFWCFCITKRIPVGQVWPLVHWLDAIRHRYTRVDGPDGPVVQPPSHPDFSLEGRTRDSVMQLMDEWYAARRRADDALTWRPSGLRPLTLRFPPERRGGPLAVWEVCELTAGAELRAEGDALRHCVATYSQDCAEGESSIWSIRRRRGDTVRSLATIEIDPELRQVVQARAFRNRPVTGRARAVLQAWCARERLRLRRGW